MKVARVNRRADTVGDIRVGIGAVAIGIAALPGGAMSPYNVQQEQWKHENGLFREIAKL